MAERTAPDRLREAAQRLSDAIATKAAVGTDGRFGWPKEMDAEAFYRCALADLRTLLDGQERPHKHHLEDPSND